MTVIWILCGFLVLALIFILYCCVCVKTSYDKKADDEQQMDFINKIVGDNGKKGL